MKKWDDHTLRKERRAIVLGTEALREAASSPLAWGLLRGFQGRLRGAPLCPRAALPGTLGLSVLAHNGAPPINKFVNL